MALANVFLPPGRKGMTRGSRFRNGDGQRLRFAEE